MEVRFNEVSSRVPELFAGASRLHVLFATYRSVLGIDSGTVEPKPGLRIDVCSWINDYSPAVNGLFLFPQMAQAEPDKRDAVLRIVADASAQMRREGRAAQAAVDRDLIELTIPEGYQFLAVCYAGRAAFQQALQSATTMKGRASARSSKVILVTCDCDLASKRIWLQPHLDAGEIDVLIVTPYCGGAETMREIFDAIVNAWPGTTAP